MEKIDINNRYDLFLSGGDVHAQEWLGLHFENGRYIFRVFAPAAESVFLVGDFNNWQESHPMVCICGGIWEISICEDELEIGDKYKYKIVNGGRDLYRSDP